MATREQLIEDFADHKYATGEKFARLINSMKVVQEPVADPAASGTSLSFIDSIEQDNDGKITATKKTLDLSNAHEINPFKGWWKTGDTLPTTGFAGAYLYFKDTTQNPAVTTIYRWNGTAYADTGTEVDESNVQTFGSGQQLNAVKIKNENGEEVTGSAGVLSAESGRNLHLQINGGTSKTLVNLNDVSIWQQGGINSATGAEQSNTKRCSTVFLQPTTDSVFSLDPIDIIPYTTGTFYCYCYDENKSYLAWGSSNADESITHSNNKILIAKLLEDFPTLKYVRINFSYDNSSSDITPEYLLNRFTFADSFYTPQVHEGLVDKVNNLDNRLQEVENSETDTNERLTEVENTLTTNTGKILVDLNNIDIWQQGSINTSNGVEQSNTKRCRTVFLEPTSDSVFSLDPTDIIPYGTGTFYCYCYNEDKSYLGWGSSNADESITHSNNKILIAKLLEDFPTLKYVRIMFDYNSNITPEYVINRFTFADSFYNPQVQEGLVDKVNNIDNRLQEVEGIVMGSETGLVLSGNSLVFTGSKGTISTVKKKTGAYYNDFNRNFNFMSASIGGISIVNEDDIAPMHIMNSTFGANHAQPCGFATISGHGLGNEAVGTLWTHSNGYKYYIVRIVNANTIAFLSENGGTETSPVYRALATGSVSNGNTTLTITAVNTGRQMWPACGNELLKVYDNNGKEITDDGEYQAEWFDVVEEYDLWTPDSVVANLVANVGSFDIVYNGDAVVHWRNIYRFLPNNNVLCIVSNTFLKSCAFQDIMFAQSAIFSSAKTYIPNSLPNNGLDFRVPVHVNWSGSVSSFNAVVGNTSNPNVPVNRVLRYNGAVGFAIGFIPSYGVAKDLSDFTLNTFEIRGDSGKIYPHGVESGVVGTTMPANKTYNAVMYRCFFDCNETSPRMSMYHFDYNGFEYVFVDYSASIYDTVVIDDRLNGKPITVVEALNTSLDDDVYNSGFNVNANYVSGETCYIVVKIG